MFTALFLGIVTVSVPHEPSSSNTSFIYGFDNQIVIFLRDTSCLRSVSSTSHDMQQSPSIFSLYLFYVFPFGADTNNTSLCIAGVESASVVVMCGSLKSILREIFLLIYFSL